MARGLDAPWDVAFDADGQAYVSECNTGRVLGVGADGALSQVARFAVDAAGEGGLLGLAADPAGGLLYAYLTTAEDNRVVRFRPGGQPGIVIDGIPKAGNHNGGRIAFGPDGKLYIGTGDAAQGELAQDRDSLAGKVLRLEPDGTVPADNPVPGSPVWSLGHRNVQGLAWDATGTLYATELGPDRDDEVNIIRRGGNYGWPLVTGAAGDPRYVDPLVVAQPSEASWSGAAVLTTGAMPSWEGDLFVTGLRGQRLWRFELGEVSPPRGEALLDGEHGRLRHVEQAPDGSLWILTSNRDGRGRPRADDDRILRLGP